MFKTEAVVVGAGVVGLSIARALALRGVQVLLLEREGAIGRGVSSRNSEVIHAGLYYEPGSLKARLCVRGREMLYRYCNERRVHHRQCGKLVVATDPSGEGYLDHLSQRAAKNGVDEIELIGPERLKSLEPQIVGNAALLSPRSGIVDSAELMRCYQADAEVAGATVVLNAPVLAASATSRTIQLRTGGVECAELEADLVVNAAGLDAWDFSARISGLDPATIPSKFLAKGNYFTLAGTRVPFQHLVYPVPEPGGLGVHLTLDLAGQARFGPDVEWVDQIDYTVDPHRAGRFYAAIRRYWPGLPDGALAPAYSGIRPKTTTTGHCDFVIQGPKDTRHGGYIALYGIESPGLTASLAIGECVVGLAGMA